MPINTNIAVLGFRWAGLVLALVVLAFAIWISEGQLDRISQPLCPEGLWHTGLGWAHCAYPPISIFKYGAMYAGYAVLALLIIQWLAPAYKVLASRVLLFVMMVAPAYHLLLVQFSWVETCKLVLVAGVALIYFLRDKASASARGLPPPAPGPVPRRAR